MTDPIRPGASPPEPGILRGILREPLFHFLIAGGLIFAAYAWVSPSRPAGGESRKIRLTAGDLSQIRQGWISQWRRTPTPEELQGLLDNRIREEIFSREALELGLDRDDVILRRRLAQKYEFLTRDLVALRTPTDAELAAYVAAHSEKYGIQGGWTFIQAYFTDEERARVALAQLRSGSAAESLGDPTLLEADVHDRREDEVARQFGGAFVEGITRAEIGMWTGPVRSTYGWHVIKIERRQAARMPDLSEIRESVVRDWTDAQRREGNDALYKKLKERYQITVEAASPGKPVLGLSGDAR